VLLDQCCLHLVKWSIDTNFHEIGLFCCLCRIGECLWTPQSLYISLTTTFRVKAGQLTNHRQIGRPMISYNCWCCLYKWVYKHFDINTAHLSNLISLWHHRIEQIDQAWNTHLMQSYLSLPLLMHLFYSNSHSSSHHNYTICKFISRILWRTWRQQNKPGEVSRDERWWVIPSYDPAALCQKLVLPSVS